MAADRRVSTKELVVLGSEADLGRIGHLIVIVLPLKYFVRTEANL
ncbi:MAG: hypothetical protein AAF414_03000 [Pseudomonadota bacterium]